MWFISSLMPESKTMYLMAGAYMGVEVASSQIVTDKMKKVNEIIDLKLNEILDDLKQEDLNVTK